MMALSAIAWGQFRPDIPKAWNEEALESMTLPVAGLNKPIHYAPADWYNRIPERQIYRGYPVYLPSKEPPNYLAFLEAQEPELAFDVAKLKTEADWIRAGESVFSSPDASDLLTVDDIHDPELWDKLQFSADAEGALPGWRYVIRKKGKLELASTLCGGCHERIIEGRTVAGPPGTSVPGAPWAFAMRRKLHAATLHGEKEWNALGRQIVARQFSLFSVPWLNPDPAEPIAKMSAAQILTAYENYPPGVVARNGASLYFPAKIPDLIGVKDRKYFGNTGLHRNRGIEDLMRYAALETGFDDYSQYGDFRPSGTLPDPASLQRLSDPQLYALALYLYSLTAPPNPNRLDKKNKTAEIGKAIFEREGCAGCHPPPLYTDNKLMAAGEIGTDPGLTLRTRRGTGSYRVPSLKGLWYRDPLEHSGSAPTLEAWFDPVRLRGKPEIPAIKGHNFGLKLSFEEKQALFEFLSTL